MSAGTNIAVRDLMDALDKIKGELILYDYNYEHKNLG